MNRNFPECFKEGLKLTQKTKMKLEAEKYPTPENKWKAYFIYALYCKDEGNFVEVIRYLKKAINIFQADCEKIPTSTYKESYLCRTDRQEVFRMMDEIEDIVRNR